MHQDEQVRGCRVYDSDEIVHLVVQQEPRVPGPTRRREIAVSAYRSPRPRVPRHRPPNNESSRAANAGGVPARGDSQLEVDLSGSIAARIVAALFGGQQPSSGWSRMKDRRGGTLCGRNRRAASSRIRGTVVPSPEPDPASPKPDMTSAFAQNRAAGARRCLP